MQTGQPLYIWRAVPPSTDFVSLGMLATTSEDQPDLNAMSCVPRRWCGLSESEPLCVWRHGGQMGGRAGSFWTSSPQQLFTLHAMQGQEPPAKDNGWALLTDRWFADPPRLEDLKHAPWPCEHTLGCHQQDCV